MVQPYFALSAIFCALDVNLGQAHSSQKRLLVKATHNNSGIALPVFGVQE